MATKKVHSLFSCCCFFAFSWFLGWLHEETIDFDISTSVRQSREKAFSLSPFLLLQSQELSVVRQPEESSSLALCTFAFFWNAALQVSTLLDASLHISNFYSQGLIDLTAIKFEIPWRQPQIMHDATNGSRQWIINISSKNH